MKIVRNPDEEYAREVKKRLDDNDGYCPCSLVKNKDTKCMCKAFREQIESGVAGECHCGLWIATE